MATNGRSLVTGIAYQRIGSGDDLNCSVETVDRGEGRDKWVMAVTLQSWRQQSPKNSRERRKKMARVGVGKKKKGKAK